MVKKHLLDFQTIQEIVLLSVEEVHTLQPLAPNSIEDANRYRHACCKLTRTLSELERERHNILVYARKLDLEALQLLSKMQVNKK